MRPRRPGSRRSKVDLTAPECGWHLLHLYYAQGRKEDHRRLAMRLYPVEPDPRDRVLLLLELVRTDARPPAPESIVNIFEPVVRYQPGEFRSALAVGLAMTRASRIDAGIDQLRRVVQAHPGRVEAWDCLLTGLDESGQVDVLKDELERLPATLSTLPQLAKHRARVAQGRNQWTEAADLYRQARAAEPDNRVVEYRLGGALRHTGRSAEADQIDRRLRRRDAASQDLRRTLRPGRRNTRPGDSSPRGALSEDRGCAGAHGVARRGRCMAPNRPGERPQERSQPRRPDPPIGKDEG